MQSLNIVSSGVKKACKQVQHLVYPIFCLHCGRSIQDRQWLCSFCSADLIFATSRTSSTIVALQAWGPALSLLKAIKGQTMESMAYALAALMAVQMQRLCERHPDVLCAWPKDLFHMLLAKNLGCIISIPVLSPLKRPGLLHSTYRWKKSVSLADKRIFVISLHGEELEKKQIFQEAAPRELTFFSVF